MKNAVARVFEVSWKHGVRILFIICVLWALSQNVSAYAAGGTVWTWGYNQYGQLGDGTTTQKITPAQVGGLTGVTAIAAGSYYTVALKSDGTVWAWGWNIEGQLGDGTTTQRNTPVQVSGLTGVTAIAIGGRHTIALKSDGTVWAWGRNIYGQLGDGTKTQRTTPVQVIGLTGVTTIAGGGNHTMALKSDGTVWAWGCNYSGVLGDGSTTHRSTPVQVSGLTGVTAIAGGFGHSIALKSDGTVWTWGWNINGQLGDGTNTDKNIPVQVSGLTSVTAVAGGSNHTIALKSDGTVRAWGNNSNGQLGDGTTTQRTTPVQVSGLSGVTAVARGSNHTIALKSDGTVRAWGFNNNGQLGDGTTTQRTTPVQVLGLTGVMAVAGGYDHTTALIAGMSSTSTSTSIYSSPNPSPFGSSVTFTATVTPSAATGTVTFKDGVTILGTGTLSGGISTFSTSALVVGTHSITAVYGGGANYVASTSPTLTQTVTAPPSTSAITAPLNGVTLTGTSYAITGTATDGSGTGLKKVEVGITPFGGTTVWYQASGTTSWSYAWALPVDGNYTIQSRATDNAGNVETPVAGRGVKVDNTPPTSTITAPFSNAILAGTTTTITGTASDSGSGVKRVQVGITNSAGSTTWYLANGTTTWSYSWNTSVEGCYTIVSRATDNTNKVEQQGAGRAIIVDRNPPASTINPPKWEFIGPYLPGAANKIVYDMVIAPTVPKTIYVGSYNGIYRSTDDGMSWTKSSGPSQAGIGDITVSPIDPNIVFAGTWYNIYKSIDGGATFNIFNNFNSPVIQSPDVGAIAIDPKTPDIIFAGIYSSVYKSTDAGTTWSKMFSSIVYDSWGSTSYMISDIVIDPVNSSVVYAVDCCHLNKSVDGGNTWFAINSGMNLNGSLYALAIDPSNSSILYAGAEGVGVYKSVNGGVSWNLVFPVNLRIHALKVDPKNTNTIYAGTRVLSGLSGGVYKSVDGGFSWGLLGIPDKSVYNLAVDLDGKLYAGTDNWVYKLNPAAKLINGSEYLLTGSIIEKGSGVQRAEISIVPKGGAPAWTGAGITDTSGNGSWSTWGYNWSLPVDGTYTVQFHATDKAGYVESPGDLAEFIVDNTPPAGSVSIVEGPYVSTHAVTLALAATDANCVPQMQISDDGVFDTEPWEALAQSRAWTLPTGDGEKTVYVRYRDTAGNVSQFAAKIIIDKTPPVIMITKPSDLGFVSGAFFTIKGAARDVGGSGVNRVEVSIDGGVTWNTASGTVDWSYKWAVPAENSTCQIKAMAIDNAGNIGIPGASITVYVVHDLAVITLEKAYCSGPMDEDNITVTDLDANATEGPGNDRITVKVISSSDTVGEVVTLEEDPAVAGRFTGKISFEPYRSFAGNGKVYVSKNDTVTVTYTDNVTPSGIPHDISTETTWTSGRAMWVRDADGIINNEGTSRADLFSFCTAPFRISRDRVDTIYLDSLSAMNNNTANLRSFITDAHAHGIRVECLAGAPEWATPDGHSAATEALDILAGFNDSGYANERFDGVHINVEPYVLQKWVSPTLLPKRANIAPTVWSGYIDMLDSCRTKVDSYNLAGNDLTLAAGIPSWFDSDYSGVTSSDAVQDIVDYSVVRVMSDKKNAITLAAQHEVEYAAISGKKVLVGVETGCGAYAPGETFCQEGYLVMDMLLESAAKEWKAMKSYMGEAINDYSGYRSFNQLPDQAASMITGGFRRRR